MNIKIVIRTLAISFIAFALLGCGEDEEAKKLGFSSVSEMKEIQAKGWHTIQRYDEDRAKASGFASFADMKADELVKLKIHEAKAAANKQAEEVKNKEEAELASMRLSAAKLCDWDILSEIISFAADKGKISTPLLEIGHNIAWEKGQNGYGVEEEKQKQEKRKIIKTGTFDFNGKKLPVCLEEITIHYVNRSEGKRKNECYQVGYASDKEFNMYRNIITSTCKNADQKINEWQSSKNISNLK